MTTYTLPPARTRSDAVPIDETRTNVVVIRGHQHGRIGYIKGTFARARGVAKVFVFFPPKHPTDAPEVKQILLSSLRPATQLEFTFNRAET